MCAGKGIVERMCFVGGGGSRMGSQAWEKRKWSQKRGV